MTDLYKRLGIEKDATIDEIKRAYRKEALSKHPDRGGEKEEFQALQVAYDVLSDPDKRAHYDMTGSIPGDGDNGMEVHMPDLSSLFGSLFGGGGGGIPFFGSPFGSMGSMGSMGASKIPRGPDKVHEIGVSLADLYKGKQFTLSMKRDVLCDSCKGSGGSRVENCGSCGGKGFRIKAQQMGPMMAMTQETCGPCGQTGKQVLDSCKGCSGKRVVERESKLEVIVQPGMQEGDRITFEGKCSESPMVEKAGDVILVIRPTAGDESWNRRGSDLTYHVRLSAAEAFLGWERTIEGHPSGRPLHLVWKEGVLREGEVLRIGGWGMPVKGTTKLGDMRLVCSIDPHQGTLSEGQRSALKSVWPDWKEPVATADSVMPSR